MILMSFEDPDFLGESHGNPWGRIGVLLLVCDLLGDFLFSTF